MPLAWSLPVPDAGQRTEHFLSRTTSSNGSLIMRRASSRFVCALGDRLGQLSTPDWVTRRSAVIGLSVPDRACTAFGRPFLPGTSIREPPEMAFFVFLLGLWVMGHNHDSHRQWHGFVNFDFATGGPLKVRVPVEQYLGGFHVLRLQDRVSYDALVARRSSRLA